MAKVFKLNGRKSLLAKKNKYNSPFALATAAVEKSSDKLIFGVGKLNNSNKLDKVFIEKQGESERGNIGSRE